MSGKTEKKLRMYAMMTIVLVFIVVIALGYIIVGNIISKNDEKLINTYRNGVTYGFSQAVSELLRQASECKPVPITFGNRTLNLYALECKNSPAYQQGYEAAILQMAKQTQTCNPITLTYYNQTKQIIAYDCLLQNSNK